MYSVPDVGFFFPVTKFIRIGIADKNDNPPYFDKELYEAEVDENEDIQHTVLTVTAKDHDEFPYPENGDVSPVTRKWVYGKPNTQWPRTQI
ncbi:hypothetical protein SFRURICE_020845 [Spodoptera frugiperda]|nr:hypothetical protein SFRURICE_020845 [Spodoptera frugiperda]